MIAMRYRRRGEGRGNHEDGRLRYTPERWRLPPSRWPERDRIAWERACCSSGPFTPRSSVSHLAPATREIRQDAYGRFLSFLDSRGELDPEQAMEDRLTEDRLSAYIQSLRPTMRAYSVQRLILELSNFIRAVAPGRDWRWIRTNPHLPTSAEVRASKKPVNAPDPYVVLQAAMHACDNAQPGETELGSALRYRDGVMIMFMIVHAIRLKNFAELRVNQHLFFHPSYVRLVIDKTVKNREIVDVHVPPFVARYLLRYFEVYRPMLLRGEEDHGAVWVNLDGHPLLYSSMGQRIALVTARWGCGMSPHDARYAAATTIMDLDPRRLAVASSMLAHRGISSVNQVYDRSGSLGAQSYWMKLRNDAGVKNRTELLRLERGDGAAS